MQVSDLASLVRVLSPVVDALIVAETAAAFTERDSWTAPSDSVVAMNHLKRLASPRREAAASVRLSHGMYSLISARTSTPPQNRFLIVCYNQFRYQLDGAPRGHLFGASLHGVPRS